MSAFFGGGNMIKFARIVGIAIALTASTPAFADVFGVQMGASPQSLGGKASADDPGPVKFYKLPAVPKPHGEFETYAAMSSAKTGICKIAGYGRSYNGDMDGHKVHDAWEALGATLEAKYGKSARFDDLDEGSIWNKPEDFAMGLKVEERTLVAYWVPKYGAKLPVDLRAIKLEASAVSGSETYLVISYEFANFGTCSALMQQADDAAL